MEPTIIFILVAVGFAVLIAVVYFSLNLVFKTDKYLAEWSKRNDFKMVYWENNYFGGPFLWTKWSWRPVVYVIVEDHSGSNRSGWILFGWLYGKEQVKWEEKSSPDQPWT
jgi:hypothetical protein